MNDCVRDEIWVTVPVTFNPGGFTVGPFTVLKFKDQNFISNIYYRKGPSFTTVSRCVRSLAGQPNFTAHFYKGRHFFCNSTREKETLVLSCSKNRQTFSVRASFSPGNASFDLNEVAASAASLLKQHLFTFQPVS